jgi:hypothetical protein
MRVLGIFIFSATIMLGQTGAIDGLAARLERLKELQSKLLQLSKVDSPSHPDVIAVRNQIAELQAQLAQSPVQQDRLRAEQDMVRARETKLQAELERNAAQQQKQSALPANLPENWWRNEGAAKTIGLSAAQIKRMDEIFQQSRLKLIDQKAALDKEEAILEPLVELETIDESKAAAQLDRVAQARAELEKTRGRMLLGIRKQLDMDQWRKLKETRTIVEKMTLR